MILPIGTKVMITSPIKRTSHIDFFPVGSRGVIVKREAGRPVIVIDGQEIMCFDKELVKSVW
ncbi:MAG TPA: hypothetical protein VEP90_10340 [Methylomirabilota bacterium]|nr:hypothetical protein [Methylomirabilota bacterium]